MRRLKLFLAICALMIGANAFADKTVYLAPGPWNVDNARFALYMFEGSGAETEKWVDFEDHNGVFSATFEDTFAKMIICRMNGQTTENNWDNKWNQSEDLSAPTDDNLLYSIANEGDNPEIKIEPYVITYTKDQLAADGWTKITSISQSDITDNFYIFVDNDENLMLGLANSSKQSSSAAFYQIMKNPALDAKKVWTIEANGGNYAMRNLYSNSRQMQTEWSGTFNDQRWRTNDQTGSIEWTGLGLTYSEGAWWLTSTEYSRPLGLYNNETGNPTEGNQIGANDAGNGQKFQIYAISREAYWALAASLATKAAPVNSFTGLIINQEIYNKEQTKLPYGWSEDTAKRKTDNSNRTAGTNITRLEGWASTQWGGKGELYVDYFQNLTKLPNGVYQLTALTGQDIYTNMDPEAGSNGKIYISNGTDEKTADVSATTEDITTSPIICDGSLKIGMRADGKQAWVHGEDFRLEYIGQAVRHAALVLPHNGEIKAGQWYKYTVEVEGAYKITADASANIIQTNDGEQLAEEATGNAVTTGTEVYLEEGSIIYYKSTTDNTLTVVPNVKTYVLGDVTDQSITNDSYISSLTTLVLTYGEAATNDDEAELAVIGSATATLKKGAEEIATGVLTADNDAKTLTVTFSDVTLETSVNDYSIVIPNGAFGYEGQQVVSEEFTVTFKTGVIADGLYYLQQKDTQKYLSRGGNYGTRSVVTDLGISFELSVQTDGRYYLKNHDHSLAANAGRYFGAINGVYYSDATSAQAFIIAPAEGGYYLCPETDKYFKTTTESENIDVPFDYISETETEGEAIVWVPISKEDYTNNIAEVRNAEVAAIATSAGITAASVDELKTLLANGTEFKGYDVTSYIKNADCIANLGNWTQVKYATNGQKDFDANGTTSEVWGGIGGIKQEIKGLTAGIYKVSIHATWRPGGKESGINAGNEINTNAWVYANTETSSNLTQLKSWYSGGATIDNRDGMKNSGDTYLNDVYVYVSEGETLTIGLASPTQCNGAWLPFFGWSLTYYKAKTTYTANFVNGEKWDKVCAYVWNGDGETAELLEGEWPGRELTSTNTVTYNGEELGIYSYSYTGFECPEKIIFNNGTKADDPEKKQTGDLSFVNDMTDESKVTFIPVYAVIGSNADQSDKAIFSGNWDAANTADIMTETDGKWTISFNNVELTEPIIFKVIKKAYLESTEAVEWYPAGGAETNKMIDLTGDFDIVITFDGSDVSYSCTPLTETFTVTAAGWATAKTAHAVDFTDTEGLEAYIATLTDDYVTLTKATQVPAETPIVLKGVTAKTAKAKVIESADPVENNALTWYPDYTVNDTHAYIYALTVTDGKAKFARVQNGVNFHNKAVIEMMQGSGARELRIVFAGEEATGINAIATEKNTESIYNMKGQRVSAPAKGLYIVNGKKVVMK